MKLNHLLRGVGTLDVKGDKYVEISNISYDSKQLKTGGVFFSIKGSKLNGADFIDEAIERGAVCIVTEEDFVTFKSLTKVFVQDVRKACAEIARNFYQNPSDKIRVAGITGTNGKTTTLYLISAILQQAGIGCGTIGTVIYNIGERRIPAVNTTPSSIMINMFLSDMIKANLPNCVMEVSSHSLHQGRVDGIMFKNAIFTNLTSEHLDYHKDMEEYFAVKKRLFNMLKDDGNAIVNIDDDYGKKISSEIKDNLLTYGISEKADVTASNIESSIKGSSFEVKTPKGALKIKTPLIGEYNVYNILAAISFAILNGVNTKDIEEAIKFFKGAPGRLERIDTANNNFDVFVDYAHTDNALENLLKGIKQVAKKRIILLFGCGGDRDKKKRPRMAKIAAELSDFVIITSDNPRSEDPRQIIEDIRSGLPKDFKDYKVYIDRRKAIEAALNRAKKGDIVLIAGKGHEKYQILKDTTVPFDDRQVAEELLETRTEEKV